MLKIIFKGLLILSSFFFYLEGKSQCAMCRAVLESEESANATQGINDGIIFLMVIPYILVASLGYLIYKAYNKNNKVNT